MRTLLELLEDLLVIVLLQQALRVTPGQQVRGQNSDNAACSCSVVRMIAEAYEQEVT